MSKYDELQDWQTKNGFASPTGIMQIYYSPEAYAKTIRLVQEHPVEVGWNMVIKPYKSGYKVYDIVVYPQKVSPAYVSVDLPRYGLWKATLEDDVDNNLFGNGHSHVNMSTFASIVDENQQHDEILTKKSGFYFFQIWNKRNEVNSFFYDIDNKIYYTANDICMIIETVDDFVTDSLRVVKKEQKIGQFEAGEDFESEQIF